jgi:CRISPR-associated protein (TIGR03984 family)
MKHYPLQPIAPVDIHNLASLMNESQLAYVLVYALDGVLWGKQDGGSLHWGDTPHKSQCSPDPQFWQEVRCFGATAELHLWKTANTWHGRLVKFEEAGFCQTVDYLLWGGRTKDAIPQNNFFLLSEEKQGIRHIAPALPNGNAPSNLVVKHIYQPDSDGQLQFQFSCLAGLA